MAVFKEDGLMPKGASLSEAPWSLSSKIKKVVGNSRGVGEDPPPSLHHLGQKRPKGKGS